MRIFAKDGKEYKSYEEAVAAEKAYDQKVAEEKARKELRDAKRAERAKEVEEAFKEVAAANKNYHELLNAFIKDYGSYHQTVRDTDIDDWGLLKNLFTTIFSF